MKNLLKKLGYDEFVSLDIETTGLDFQSADILEVGLVHFSGGKVKDQYSMVLDPGYTIPDVITKLTGIQDQDRIGKPKLAEIQPEILRFIGNHILIAHNINFDLNFLESKMSLSFPNEKVDTLLLSQIFFPMLSNHKLGSLLEYFQIPQNRGHRALEDAINSGKIFIKLIEESACWDLKTLQPVLTLLNHHSDPIAQFFKNLFEYFKLAGKIDESSIRWDLHSNILGEPAREEEELSLYKIIEEKAIQIVSQDGFMAKELDGFEHRSEQIEMVRAVTRAFNQSEFLVAEAGTGTGKSFAYLVPSILWTQLNRNENERVIVSTNTKNLQEQLFYKDIPLLHKIFQQNFSAVLLKGRSNYLCLDKWNTILTAPENTLNPNERVKLLPIASWVTQTLSGDFSENNAFKIEHNYGLWQKLIAEHGYCYGSSCRFYNDCYVYKARHAAKKADIVVVNHSLLFSDLVTENSILENYQNVIFDEAHNLEKVASDYMGIEFTQWMVRSFCLNLYQREQNELGTLVTLRMAIHFSRLEEASKQTLNHFVENIIGLSGVCWKRSQEFFISMTSSLAQQHRGSSTLYPIKQRYSAKSDIFGKFMHEAFELDNAIRELREKLSQLVEFYKEIPANTFPNQDSIRQEITSSIEECHSVQGRLDRLLFNCENEDYVYWYELPTKIDSFDTRLYGVPLNISEILNDQLYTKLHTAIFTSATLAVGGEFHYLKEQIGINRIESERAVSKEFGSPFDYRRQMMIGLPAFLTNPQEKTFFSSISEFLLSVIQEVRRGTLILFTSYDLLNSTYHYLKQNLVGEDILLLGQNKDGNRNSLLQQFKEKKNAVMLGTDSFWEGIDVPGEALELLIITKLPFEVPSDPVYSAKIEQIDRRGGNSFLELSVPEAVIKLRQGIGRLIRTKTDGGAVLILDNRILTKRYGKIFINSLPVEPSVYHTKDDTISDLIKWFKKIN